MSQFREILRLSIECDAFKRCVLLIISRFVCRLSGSQIDRLLTFQKAKNPEKISVFIGKVPPRKPTKWSSCGQPHILISQITCLAYTELSLFATSITKNLTKLQENSEDCN